MNDGKFVAVAIGNIAFFRCPSCSAIVDDVELHKHWHEKLSAHLGIDEYGRKVK